MIARVCLLQSICRELLACKEHDQPSHMSHLMVYGLSLPIVGIIPTLPTMFSRERLRSGWMMIPPIRYGEV